MVPLQHLMQEYPIEKASQGKSDHPSSNQVGSNSTKAFIPR